MVHSIFLKKSCGAINSSKYEVYVHVLATMIKPINCSKYLDYVHVMATKKKHKSAGNCSNVDYRMTPSWNPINCSKCVDYVCFSDDEKTQSSWRDVVSSTNVHLIEIQLMFSNVDNVQVLAMVYHGCTLAKMKKAEELFCPATFMSSVIYERLWYNTKEKKT